MLRLQCCVTEFITTLLTSTALACSLFFAMDSPARAADLQEIASAENVRLGERMYRDGILPSGEPLQSFIKGDISVPGTSFSCISCHLRSGLGSFEGGVITPPTNGSKLFQAFGMSYKKVAVEEKYFPPHQQRSAYSDQSLATALREGVNPSGQVMNPVMPRYQLNDTDMALLIAYLKSLSSRFSPGVSETTIHFASVITDDVRPEEYEAMLAPLDQYVRHKNNMVKMYKTQKRSERMAAVMLESSELMYKKMTLSRWFLKGPPDSWQRQLEDYCRKEPVFALLGGMSHGDWKPIHDFSETHRIPSLFPQTGFPVVSESDWYTLYFSKGYYQEGEAAARYLNSRPESLQRNINVLQLVRSSPEGNALSTGFNEAWHQMGRPAPVSVILKPGEALSKDRLQALITEEKPTILILWDGPSATATLETLATISNRPDTVIVSAGYLGSGLWTIAEQARAFTYITYPYRMPGSEERFKPVIESFKTSTPSGPADETGLKQTYITTQILTQALMDLRGNYYGDNFLDVIGMFKDQELPLYERLSFGPGQRYASKGCFIVQLGTGAKPELVRKSDWVMH